LPSETAWLTFGMVIYSFLSLVWLWGIYKVWAMSSSSFVKKMVFLLFIQALTWLIWLIIFVKAGDDKKGDIPNLGGNITARVFLAISYFTFLLA
jgi:hypothetical protein